LGFDTFSYQIVDSTGMTQTGRVHIMVEEFASFIYEAEDAVIVGAQIDQFWVDYINASGDYVEWTVDVATAADYDLAWRYSLASGDRPLEIKVNGQVVEPSMSFPATGSFGTWDFTAPLRVSLNAGTNTARATAIGSSGANIDYLKVTETIDTSGPQAPYFYYDPTDKPFALVGQSYNDTLADTANDPDLNEILTFSKLGGPDWLNVASDGTLSGTPIPADMGTNVFTVRVTDSTALTADTTLIIDVYQKTGEATYEAEDAVYVGPIFGNYYGGYTGTGYVDYQNSSGDYVLWTINASEAGLASLEFRYALGSGDRPLEITVNGQVVEPSLSFPSTGNFGTWDYTSILMVTLNAGDNTVQATAIGSSGANVDHLKVGFYSTTGGEDTIPPTPDPMTWAVLPHATGTTSISMTATTASDPSGVQYYFTCTAGGGNDSNWQASPTYEDTGLSPDTTYTYTVTARDLSVNQNETAPSTAESATTLQTGTTDDVANGETTVAGTVIGGSYLDTQASDNVYEAIQEIESGGNPNKRNSYLEHKWTINVTGGDSVTFFVEAYHTTNSEGDDFIFAYSTDDVSYTNMVVVTKTADDDNQQSFVLPSSISGTVYIRVTDSDQTQGNKALDTVYVDHMFIRSETGGGPCTPTDCHVQSIVCDTAPGSKGKKFGQVTVTIYDDCGNPVIGADVDGTFTGDFDDTIYDITTNGNGQAVFTTSTQVKNPVYQFCVDDVTHGTLPYDSGDNVETCDNN
ncbi:MAG: CBM35 domain-containing protein, partial [Planctomycetota bacterium]